MKSMTHRERVMAALNHKQPDRVPIDFGGTRATCIVAPAYENLKKYLGLKGETSPYAKGRYARTIVPDEVILRKFDIDTRMLKLGEFKGSATKKIIDAETYVDMWGITWKQTPTSFSMDIEGPFQKSDPTIKTLEAFPWPDPNDPGIYEGLKERAESLRKNSDCAIVLGLIASMSGIMKQAMKMRGAEEFLMDLHDHPAFICSLMDIITDISVTMAEKALAAVGSNVDVIYYAEDLGHQQSTFMSPKYYREFVKPRHKRLIGVVKANSDAKILLHSDGSVYTIIEDLIDIGIDALNPIQVSARNMDPAILKKEFGNRLAFWGAIDTRDVLPFGSPEEVRAEVRRIIDLLGDGGGYVLSSVQTIQAEVPPENIVAMFDEARSHRKAV